MTSEISSPAVPALSPDPSWTSYIRFQPFIPPVLNQLPAPPAQVQVPPPSVQSQKNPVPTIIAPMTPDGANQDNCLASGSSSGPRGEIPRSEEEGIFPTGEGSRNRETEGGEAGSRGGLEGFWETVQGNGWYKDLAGSHGRDKFKKSWAFIMGTTTFIIGFYKLA
jgi:hypothetical protein